MKLERTINYNFGWLVLVALVNVAFLLVFFLLLSSNFILQQGISVSMPFSRFTLGPRLLLVYFPSGLSAHSHASATAGPYRFDHSCIGRGSHAASLDRRRRSCGCFYDSSSAGNEAPPSAEG